MTEYLESNRVKPTSTTRQMSRLGSRSNALLRLESIVAQSVSILSTQCEVDRRSVTQTHCLRSLLPIASLVS